VNIGALQKHWQQYSVESLQSLQHHTELACSAGIKAEYQQVAGTAGKTICQVAQQWGADLIMVGNRGRIGFREFVLGSVSNYVMHHATCSVLIVKSTSE
jgi:nucleotide-binding universal stress UspA family protein